jgi:hypothetical protein
MLFYVFGSESRPGRVNVGRSLPLRSIYAPTWLLTVRSIYEIHSLRSKQLYRLTVRPIVLGRLEVTAPGAALHSLLCPARWTFSRSPLSIRLEPGLYCGNDSQAKSIVSSHSRDRTPTCHHLIPVPRIRPPRRGSTGTKHAGMNVLQQELATMHRLTLQQGLQQPLRRMDLLRPSRLWLSQLRWTLRL